MKTKIITILLMILLAVPGLVMGDETFINGVKVDMNQRQFKTLNLTANTVLTVAQVLEYYIISNQGAAGEIDITWPAISHAICNKVEVSESQVIEINPPSGEAPYLDGSTLHADDCADTAATTGNFHYVSREQADDGTWRYHFSSHTGSLTDTGATD